MQIRRLFGFIVATGLGLVAVHSNVAQAAGNLVVNGDFSDLKNQTSSAFGTLYPDQVIAGWNTTGYNFVFLPGAAVAGGAAGPSGTLKLWGVGDGSANGFTGTVPGGGNFIGADGAYSVGPITQTLTGLVVDGKVGVSFTWAGAQQTGFNGATTEDWQVSLGNSTQTTTPVSIVNHGFSGWVTTTFEFVATSSTEVLSFLAQGTPNGEPPFSLLADVSAMNEVADPAPLPALAGTPIGAGVLAMATLLRNRRRNRDSITS